MSTSVKTKAVKVYENDTDFTVCVFECKKGEAIHYTVTVYDIVSKEHEAIKSFRHEENAIKYAKVLNSQY